MPQPQKGATHYHAQLGLPDKGQAIKGLVVCSSWDLELMDLLKRSGPRLLSTVLLYNFSYEKSCIKNLNYMTGKFICSKVTRYDIL